MPSEGATASQPGSRVPFPVQREHLHGVPVHTVHGHRTDGRRTLQLLEIRLEVVHFRVQRDLVLVVRRVVDYRGAELAEEIAMGREDL